MEMRKLNTKSAVTTSEITIAIDAADAIAATLIQRVALDASDLTANEYAFAGLDLDFSLESGLDVGPTPEDITLAPPPAFIDPMSIHGDLPVKLAFLIDDIEVDIGLSRADQSSVEAARFANASPFKPVIIRDAVTGTELHTVYPVKGSPKTKVNISEKVSTPRQTSTGKRELTAEERAQQREEMENRDYEAWEKRCQKLAKLWDDTVDEAEKDNAKFDKARLKALRKKAADIAKAKEAMRRTPKEGTDNFEIFKLFSEEHGLTCMEGNHAMNVLKNKNDSNYGWKQKGKELAAFDNGKYNKVLIGRFRVCAVAYAKTGKTDKSMKEAMRLLDKSYDEAGNLIIPNGWYEIID